MLAHSTLVSTPLIKRDRRPSIPTPFITEAHNYSFRRDRPQTECTPEPSKPVHRNNTVSRITSKRSLFTGPKVLGGVDTASFLSTPGYSDKTPQTYLQQCFQTTQVLGEGSFGKVFKCREKVSGTEYAVKVSECYNARAVEEVRKHEALANHPHCVQFYKGWEEGKFLYIQMELCDESLQCYISRVNSKLSEVEVWRILHHCLSGLEYLHSNQLLHMDIKPDNIFRFCSDNSTVYKLGDFGLTVTVAELLNKTDIIEGDSKYLAPELLDRQCDEKADIFSLGISILEIMADLDLPNNGELWHALRNGNLPLTPGYSLSLRHVVTIMLMKEPSKRPHATEILNNQSVKCYSWVNFFKDWSDYVKNKGNSVVNYFWRKEEGADSNKDDLFDGMVELEDDNFPPSNTSHLTPRETKNVTSQITPRETKNVPSSAFSPCVSVKMRFTPVHGSPVQWPGSPSLSPVHSASKHYFTDKFESSTPNKSLFNLEDSDTEDCEQKPAVIKRNLLDSFADNEDSDESF